MKQNLEENMKFDDRDLAIGNNLENDRINETPCICQFGVFGGSSISQYSMPVGPVTCVLPILFYCSSRRVEKQ